MSTRSCIARPIGDEWEGRYHHSDGYPTGLGDELWHLVQAWGVEMARTRLIDEHPAGWSSILGADWSMPPGYRTRSNFDDLLGPRCYCHGDRAERENMIHSRDEENGEAPLFIEWVYVLGTLGLTVYAHEEGKGLLKSGVPAYRWRVVNMFPWDGEEPDWAAMEEATR